MKIIRTELSKFANMSVLGCIGYVLVLWAIVTFFLSIFQYFTEIILINPGYFQFIIIFDSDLTPWVIGGIGIILLLVDQTKERAAKARGNLVLGDNETLIKDASIQGRYISAATYDDSVNGHLLLTNQRIKFDGYDVLDDKDEEVEVNDYDFEILIKDIASVKLEEEVNLTITTKNGKKYMLIVYKGKSWVEDIEKLLGNSVGIE